MQDLCNGIKAYKMQEALIEKFFHIDKIQTEVEILFLISISIT